MRDATERHNVKPLPYTRIEVETIAGLFGSQPVRTYLGPEATEERAKAVGKDVRIVHFATHGLLNNDSPLNSALALTIPAEFSEDRENGLLQVWEIFERVRLDADLVVLSACRTAAGKEQFGEGLIGLSRAFQYAGARSVLATQWSVPDRTTAELMSRFYRHLLSGKTQDEALRAAQLELIRGEVKTAMGDAASAPFYWAAFQVIGDWQ
ncbi:MAG: CHAT domain-containing protein [bacterium]|nr:CHAT domain-containing protein [bacterium]